MIDMNLLDKALTDVVSERHRQDRKFNDSPYWPDNFGVKLSILTEEVGEVAKAILENGESSDELRDELIQVAAVAVKWVESIDAVRCHNGS